MSDLSSSPARVTMKQNSCSHIPDATADSVGTQFAISSPELGSRTVALLSSLNSRSTALAFAMITVLSRAFVVPMAVNSLVNLANGTY